MLFHKIRDRDRKFVHLQIATTAQFVSYIFGDVLGPALLSVECDDADRIVILARKEILDNDFEVCSFVVGAA
jgi:hypothetical protein